MPAFPHDQDKCDAFTARKKAERDRAEGERILAIATRRARIDEMRIMVAAELGVEAADMVTIFVCDRGSRA